MKVSGSSRFFTYTDVPNKGQNHRCRYIGTSLVVGNHCALFLKLCVYLHSMRQLKSVQIVNYRLCIIWAIEQYCVVCRCVESVHYLTRCCHPWLKLRVVDCMHWFSDTCHNCRPWCWTWVRPSHLSDLEHFFRSSVMMLSWAIGNKEFWRKWVFSLSEFNLK